MQKAKFIKPPLGGEVTLPASKSVAHRALICAALSGGRCVVAPVDNSKDMQATFNFIRAMGCSLEYDGEKAVIAAGSRSGSAVVDCIESGSTLRFIIPIMAALGIDASFEGCGRLPSRPIELYTQILRGVTTFGSGLPFSINGQLQSGDFEIRGDISSQFITGLLLALPLLKGDSKIILTTKLQSESYVNITLEVMKSFGVSATKTEYGYFVKGSQQYMPVDFTVEGDWSQAAFFLTMAAFTKEPIILKGLRSKSSQGDKKCIDLYRRLGIEINLVDEVYYCTKGKGLKGIIIDAGDVPDVVPAISVLMALAKGESRVENAARLRIKESDRLSAVVNTINNLGGKAEENGDCLIIQGVDFLLGGEVQGCGDHRIVMSAASALGGCKEQVQVTDPLSVNKSYPSFFKDYESLGGVCSVVNMG